MSAFESMIPEGRSTIPKSKSCADCVAWHFGGECENLGDGRALSCTYHITADQADAREDRIKRGWDMRPPAMSRAVYIQEQRDGIDKRRDAAGLVPINHPPLKPMKRDPRYARPEPVFRRSCRNCTASYFNSVCLGRVQQVVCEHHTTREEDRQREKNRKEQRGK